MVTDVTEHPNVRLVAEAYERLDGGDVRAFLGTFDRELRFHFLRAMPPIVGTHERLRGWINGMLTPRLAVTDGTFAPRPRWLRAAVDHLVSGHFDVRFELCGRARHVDAVYVLRVYVVRSDVAGEKAVLHDSAV